MAPHSPSPYRALLALALLAQGVVASAPAKAAQSDALVLVVRGDHAEELAGAAEAALEERGLTVIDRQHVEAQLRLQGIGEDTLPSENQLRGLALLLDARAVIVIQVDTEPEGTTATLQVVSPSRATVDVRTVRSAPEELTVRVAVAVTQLGLDPPERAPVVVVAAEPPPSPTAAPTVPTAPTTTPSPGAEPLRVHPATTGRHAGFYLATAPAGSVDYRDGTPIAGLDGGFRPQVGFGFFGGGVGRVVGSDFAIQVQRIAGEALRGEPIDTTLDLIGAIRFRHRFDAIELYAGAQCGNSFEILRDGGRTRGVGYNCGVLPGVRFRSPTNTWNLYVEAGFFYRRLRFRHDVPDWTTAQRVLQLNVGFTSGP